MSLINSGTWKLGPQLMVPFWGVKGCGLAEGWMSLEAGSESSETGTIFSSLFLLPAFRSRYELSTCHLRHHNGGFFARMDASPSGTVSQNELFLLCFRLSVLSQQQKTH